MKPKTNLDAVKFFAKMIWDSFVLFSVLAAIFIILFVRVHPGGLHISF
jgi:hypothetical protein